VESRNPVTRVDIVEAAVELIEAGGIAALTMRALATRLGIKAPSLYEHVRNREDIVGLVQTRALQDFRDAFRACHPSAAARILFYRQWAQKHAHLYPVVFQTYLYRDLLPQGLEQEVLSEVITAVGGSHLEARVAWALLHGLVDLELQGRFPLGADLDATWDVAVRMLGTLADSESPDVR